MYQECFVFFISNDVHLAAVIFIPMEWRYLFVCSRCCWVSSFVAARRRRSSAKASDEMEWLSLIRYPLIVSSSRNGSIMALNINWDTGSPCLTPRFSATFVVVPICVMSVLTWAYELMIEALISWGISWRGIWLVLHRRVGRTYR